MKRSGIREVARSCGLSVTTVSHALSGRGRVAAATVERVRAKAREIGYAPDPHAAILARRGYSPNAGVPVAVLPWRSAKLELPNPAITQALRRLGEARGYHVTVIRLEKPEQLPQACRALYHRGVRGVFIPPTAEFEGLAPTALEPFSVVAVGRHLGLPRHCSVYHDIFDSTRMALRELAARGYRRILPLLAPHAPELEDDEERWAAVEAERRLMGRRGPVLAPVMTPRSRLDAFSEVRKAGADAVLGFNDREVVELRERGVRIPEELGVAVLHSLSASVAGWWMEPETMAEACLDLMTALLRQRELGAPAFGQHVRVARAWREGATLRPRVLPASPA